MWPVGMLGAIALAQTPTQTQKEAAVAGAPTTAAGGAEIRIPWTRTVAHARADAGAIVHRAGRAVRWRAPAVCAPARAEVVLQAYDGSEESFPVNVAPKAPASDLVLVRTGEGLWELQLGADGPIAFAASAGAVEALPAQGTCARAGWKLDAPPHPDLAVAAAFEGERLAGWVVLPRPSWGEVELEADPGETVSVEVGGRRFVAVANADGVAQVRVEAPPGHSEAHAIGPGGEPFVMWLSPPTPVTRHEVTAPDGTLWFFKTDRRGRADDGDPPEGSVRMAPGVYRRASGADRAPSPGAPAR